MKATHLPLLRQLGAGLLPVKPELGSFILDAAYEIEQLRADAARLRAILNTFPWLVSVVPADRLLSGGGAS